MSYFIRLVLLIFINIASAHANAPEDQGSSCPIGLDCSTPARECIISADGRMNSTAKSLSSDTTSMSNSAINWMDYSAAALKKAKEMNRPILLFVKSDGCPWSEKMTETTFMDNSVINEVNKDYVAVVIYFNESNAATIKYKIVSLPTLIILTPDGEIKNRYSGYLDKIKMTAILKRR